MGPALVGYLGTEPGGKMPALHGRRDARRYDPGAFCGAASPSLRIASTPRLVYADHSVIKKNSSNKTTTQRPVRVGLISLGCAKNLVDAEIMLGSLMKGGLEITNDAAQADVVIVNTCSFIDSAQEESVDAILESAELRRRKTAARA